MNSVENKAFTAIQQRKDKVLSRLLDEGLDVNLRDPDGDSLLLYAAKQGRTEILKGVTCKLIYHCQNQMYT